MTLEINSSNLNWNVYLPLEPPRQLIGNQNQIADHALLEELSKFRGRILYEGGRRSQFLNSKGEFEDYDLVDLYSYHIVVRLQNRIVGCSRVTLLHERGGLLFQKSPAASKIENLIQKLGIPRSRCAESSRWLVDPEFRGKLGSKLVYASLYIALELGLGMTFASTGTRNHQDKMMSHLGIARLEGMDPFYSQEFDDEIIYMYVDLDRAHSNFLFEVRTARQLF